ncbi:MAG: winged helix-turn-helix domain-containing protein [Candidatus Hydrothermarchaeales archaeon]
MALKDIFEETPIIKILDHLIDHKGFDYTKTEIAKHAGIGWSTLNRHWDKLERWDFVKATRTIGRATLYTLNEDNPIVQKLLKFDMEAASYMAERIAQEEIVKEEMQKVKQKAGETA